MNELHQVDLAFVVDTTGSMGAFITTARQHMTKMLRALSTESGLPLDLRLAVVEYRDHPPQDHTFAARAHDFTADLARLRKIIDGLKPEGGGDAPESVFDGLKAACDELSWRPHSRRLAVLIGDAPPHGAGLGAKRPCACGLTTEATTALLEAKGVTLYSLGLTNGLSASFGPLATFTGGEHFDAGQGEQVIEALKRVLQAEFEGLDLDRRVLELTRAAPEWTVDGVSEALASGRGRVAASLSRLGRRGLLTVAASL
jgi:hypothetical protein